MKFKSRILFIPIFIFFAFLGAYPKNTLAETAVERENRLRQELAAVEEEIAEQQSVLAAKQRESVSLERDIAILTAQINEAKLKIKARNITIARLSKDIGLKSRTISELSARIENSKDSLSQLVRKTNETDSFSLAEVVLNNGSLSDFFDELADFEAIKESLHELIGGMAEAKGLTEAEKDMLAGKRTEESEARRQIEVEKQRIEVKEGEKQRLLGLSKNEEKNYKKVIEDRQKRAAEIRTALFGLRDTSAIPFGTALSYANEAFQKTGVRPAFLLAILTQESNLGENIGSCYLTDSVTGDGKRISTGAIMPKTMNPTRDVPVFMNLMQRLGRNPFDTRVSCPWQVGWGGAMGPSQFIPSTWVSYEYELKSLLQASVPDPWEPKHAFMASALYLKDLGAASGTYAAEREAALKYYAGTNWRLSRNAFYGDQVMQKALSIQTNMIEPLQNL